MLPLLFSSVAHAWGTHCLVTDRALVDAPATWELDRELPVEPLSAFLAADGPGVAKVFDDYYAWLGTTGSHRFQAQRFPADAPTEAAFFTAARLNPATKLPSVERVLPGTTPAGPLLPLADVSTWMMTAPALQFDFVAAGPTTTPRRVLVTYVDEPDWGFDHELWGIAAYGYGEQPYGKPTGESSKAPFHMKFAHENGLVRKFAPEVTEGMPVERAELFARLAKEAFASGHAYWGYRFAAWSMHYVEDLGQPYHAKALPSVGGGYYVRYVVSPMKERMKTKASQRAANRHFLYEDFVSYGLQQSYVDDDAARDRLAGYLGGTTTYDAPDVSALAAAVMDVSAAHARTIDTTLMKAFGRERTQDWRYDLTADPAYRIDTTLAEVPADEAGALLEQTGVDFENTGKGARTVLALVGAAR